MSMPELGNRGNPQEASGAVISGKILTVLSRKGRNKMKEARVLSKKLRHIIDKLGKVAYSICINKS